MQTSEILKWSSLMDELHAELDVEDDSLERDLIDAIGRKKCLALADLKKAVLWKFSGYQARINRVSGLISDNAAGKVREKTKVAFDRSLPDGERIRGLLGDHGGIRGVGGALASVLLSFCEPERFGIFDYHTWNELHREGRLKNDGPSDYYAETYEDFLAALRKIQAETGLAVRTIEKGYYFTNWLRDNL